MDESKTGLREKARMLTEMGCTQSGPVGLIESDLRART